VWTNETARVRYQFHAALSNTCGVCLQYHLKIGPFWPIPIHHGCRCRQVAIRPGQRAPEPFTDYRRLLDGMPHDQQVAAIGASNYTLLQKGVAAWEDIVTPSRVRDFREVVARKGLTVEQLRKAGIRRYMAERAHGAIHTSEHEAAEAHRRRLAERLKGAGLSQAALKGELARRLAARVSIAPGPPGEGGIPAWPGGPLPGKRPGHAAELARLLAAAVAGPKPKPAPTAGPALPGVQDVLDAARTATQHYEGKPLPHHVWERLVRDPRFAGLSLEASHTEYRIGPHVAAVFNFVRIPRGSF
jgi:hypothetical protein